MDFSYPADAEAFRDELRSWLAAHLTGDIVAAGRWADRRRLACAGESAIQVFGGIGHTWDHDAHLYLKRLLSWSAFLGGPDRYLREIGSQLARTVHTPRSTP